MKTVPALRGRRRRSNTPPDGVVFVPKEGATKYYQPYQVWRGGRIIYFAYTEERAQRVFANHILGIRAMEVE